MRTLRVVVAGLAAVALLAAPGAVAASTPTWRVQPTVAPKGNATFNSVSCPTTTECMAVGEVTSQEDITQPWAERWNGRTWTTEKVPPLPGMTSEGAVDFAGVSCPSSTLCVAVGWYVPDEGDGDDPPTYSFSEVWRHGVWGRRAVASLPLDIDIPALVAISCPTTTSCVAVGSELGPSGDQLLSESWRPGRWTLISTGTAPGDATGFTSVSCPVAGRCTAVSNVSNQTATGVVATLSDGAWAYQTIPGPAQDSILVLQAISCPTEQVCVVVGGAETLSSGAAFASEWIDGGWHLVSDLPDKRAYLLNGISCPTATQCVAVGSGPRREYAASWTNGHWTGESLPAPAATSALLGVSCRAVDACTAVGSSSTNSGAQSPLAERN